MPELALISRDFPVREYALGDTLDSGQAFRWVPTEDGWTGVIGHRWVRLRASPDTLIAEAAAPVEDWTWLTEYLQLDRDLDAVLRTFPDEEPLRAAVSACRGLRLLRQDPWECLASFILSSTKQIVQIRQIVSNVCQCFGESISAPAGEPGQHAFPSAARLAGQSESGLRQCKMGFRAPYLLGAAEQVASGAVDLKGLSDNPLDHARSVLMTLPGVGRKIADCVLLFSLGFETAFPVDVWVLKALRQFYFPGRRVKPAKLRQFTETHFGPYGGYAQQYLFHYMRTRNRLTAVGSKSF